MTHSRSFSCILTPLIHSPFGRGGQGVRTQLERPGLRDKRLAETVVPLLAHDPKPGRLVQPPGGGELALGPEHELAVARLAGEAHAFVHQARAEARPTRLRLDPPQAQLRDPAPPRPEGHPPHPPALPLRAPAAPPPPAEALGETRPQPPHPGP